MVDAEVEAMAREAALALERGQLELAAQHLARAEAVDALNPLWPRRLAEVHRRLGRIQQAVEALSRAAGLYSGTGDLVKAIAISKEIMALEPRRGTEQVRQAIRVVPGTPVNSAPPPALALGDNMTLDSIDLRLSIPGATPLKDESEVIYEIPLDDAIDLALGPPSLPPPVTPSAPPRSNPPAVSPSTPPTAAGEAHQALPKTPLFSALSAKSFLSLIAGSKLLKLQPGEIVFRQGDPADALYVVAEGAVRVIAEGPERTPLGDLGEGEFFGEIALITDEPRSATVEAATEASVLAIDRKVVHQVLEEDAWVITVFLKFLRDRFMQKLFRTHPLFASLPEEDRRQIERRGKFLEIEPNSSLIRQGDVPKGLFIVLSGRVDILRSEGGDAHKLAVLRPGDLCGEMSLLTRQPAIATARAATKVFAVELPAGTFYQLVTFHPAALEFVKTLAEARRQKVSAIVSGREDFSEGSVGPV
jgi:CRP-like cAMP-binding protein